MEGTPDWIELHNPTNARVDLGGVQIGVDGDRWALPEGAFIEAGAESAAGRLRAIGVGVALAAKPRVVTSALSVEVSTDKGAVAAATIGIVVAMVAKGVAVGGSGAVADSASRQTNVAIRTWRTDLIEQTIGVRFALGGTDLLAGAFDAKGCRIVAIQVAFTRCTAFAAQANVAQQADGSLLKGSAVAAKGTGVEARLKRLSTEAVVPLLAVAIFGA